MSKYDRNYYIKNRKRINEYGKKWKAKHHTHVLEEHRRYYQEHKAEQLTKSKEYYKNNIESLRKHYRKYMKSKHGKYIHLKSTKKYIKKFPERQNARVIAQKKIKIRGQLCQSCKRVSATQRHHPDYKTPLYVVLLCAKCHREEHKKGEYNRNLGFWG